MASWLSTTPKPGSVHEGHGHHDYPSSVEDEASQDEFSGEPVHQFRMVMANYENPIRGTNHANRIVITASTVPGKAIVLGTQVGGRMHPLFSHTACPSPAHWR